MQEMFQTVDDSIFAGHRIDVACFGGALTAVMSTHTTLHPVLGFSR